MSPLPLSSFLSLSCDTHLYRPAVTQPPIVSVSSRHLNTSSLLCDCQLKWLPRWVAEQAYIVLVNASCAHPLVLKGKSVFAVGQEEFVCGE